MNLLRTVHCILVMVTTLFYEPCIQSESCHYSLYTEDFSIRKRDDNFAACYIKTKACRCTHYVYCDIEINIASLVSLLIHYSFSTLLFLRSGLSYQWNLSKHQPSHITTIRRLLISIQTAPFMCLKTTLETTT